MNDKLDFGELVQIEPHKDSWAKVCARLDVQKCNNIHKLRLKILYEIIPFAASFIFICLAAIIFAISQSSNSENFLSAEVIDWYSSLGASQSDDFETFEEVVGFNYLIKE